MDIAMEYEHIHKLREDRLALLRFIKSDHRRKPFLPYMNTIRNDIVMVHRSEDLRRGMVFIFSLSDVPNVQYIHWKN